MTKPNAEPELPKHDDAGEPLLTPESKSPIWSWDGIVWFPTGLKGWVLVAGGAILIGVIIAWL